MCIVEIVRMWDTIRHICRVQYGVYQT